jgi:hypothetical protein
MTDTKPGLSARAAVTWVRRHTPSQWHEPPSALPADRVAADFAARYAGIPANSLARTEPVVCYRVNGRSMPVLLGLYGCAERVRAWLPGLPRRTDRAGAQALLARSMPPVVVPQPTCHQRVHARVDLTRLPALRATPRDAGPYLTTGVVMAGAPDSAQTSLSVHRMLVLGRDTLAIWMVPGRALRRLHEAAVLTGRRLPVSINIGAPPAAVVASALSSSILPSDAEKLHIAGAMAERPVAIAGAMSQPVAVLAESEIVLEGYLDGTVTDESLSGPPDVSLPAERQVRGRGGRQQVRAFDERDLYVDLVDQGSRYQPGTHGRHVRTTRAAAWHIGLASPARMTMPATESSATATLGATRPPMLWPPTNTRSESTVDCCWSSLAAALAYGTYSWLMVKPGAVAKSGCTKDTRSKRATATPRLASPQARSLSGLFIPLVSSRSNGPPPLSSTTPGHGPGPCGRVSVPGTASAAVPTVISCSPNRLGSA